MTTELRLDAIVDSLRASGRFATVEIVDGGLRCRARDLDCEAHYLLAATETGVVVRFQTPDRWLSESVEADLYHSSDSLDELLEEALDELEWPVDEVPVTRFRHYRNDDLAYVFEHDVPAHGDTAETARTWMLAYEATFHELGDVAGGDEED